LFQLLIPQALNSFLASPQARWAPLSFLPDIFTLLLYMINPLLISISFSWVIINFIYFYAPTITRMYPSNYFMDGSAFDSILPIQCTCHCIQDNCSTWGASNPHSSNA
jgi:hypothetical protein